MLVYSNVSIEQTSDSPTGPQFQPENVHRRGPERSRLRQIQGRNRPLADEIGLAQAASLRRRTSTAALREAVHFVNWVRRRRVQLTNGTV
jgi:hypothetical protein